MKNKGNVLLISLGIVLVLLFCLFLGGFGYWIFPGMFLVSLGVANTITLYLEKKNSSTTQNKTHLGISLILIGVSGLVSTIPHVLLGLLQIMSFIVIAIGVIILIVARKTEAVV